MHKTEEVSIKGSLMRKIELFENMPRLESSIQTISDAYRRTMREKNNLLDFSDVIIEQDVPTIAGTLIQMEIDVFTISGFYDNLGRVLLEFQKFGFSVKCVITVKSGYRGDYNRVKATMVPALLLTQKGTKPMTISVKPDEQSENGIDDSLPKLDIAEVLMSSQEPTVEKQPPKEIEIKTNSDDDKRGGKCRYCGQTIPYSLGRRRLYCSDECRKAWWNEHSEEGVPRAGSLKTLNCAYCGKQFTTWGNHHRKYCSHECYVLARFGRKKKKAPKIPPQDYW
jgi:endogenous inhibitor of DNA gyrase (YacG/DUF329 family)